jgi:hypothetical protein
VIASCTPEAGAAFSVMTRADRAVRARQRTSFWCICFSNSWQTDHDLEQNQCKCEYIDFCSAIFNESDLRHRKL